MPRFFGMIPGLSSFLAERSNQVLNVCAGVVCGVAEVVGMEIFPGQVMDEALSLHQAAEACRGELPGSLASEHDQIREIMREGGEDAIRKSKALMASAGIDKKCIEIFGLVCTKAKAYGALKIIKEACINLWD